MITETTQVSAKELTRNFVEKVTEGHKKQAEDESSAFIRSRMRQTSVAREVINPIVLADDELDRDEFTDLPKKIVEKEPDSTATFVTFKGTGDRTWFSGPRYSIKFAKIESQHFTKSKFELMSYQNDIRKILSENSVKDMSDIEDGKFFETCLEIVAATPAQDLTMAGPLTYDAIAAAIKAHVARRVPVGKIVMSKNLFYDVLRLPATSVGNDIASRHYNDGVEEEEKLWGFPVITTIKEDLVPDNTFWIFSTEEYLGNFFLLQDATLFIKQEADILDFWSYMVSGIGIGNTKSVTRMVLT